MHVKIERSGWALGSAFQGLHAPVETYLLPNGLMVMLHEDHRLPKVVVHVKYGVGARDDPPTNLGLAHLVEHLMFCCVTAMEDKTGKWLEGTGDFSSAYTTKDETLYFSEGPSHILPTLLWLEAGRIGAFKRALTPQGLERERRTVETERPWRIANTNIAKADRSIRRTLYPKGHPYRHAVLGQPSGLQSVSLEMVANFWDAHYSPGNAVLVVAGDFAASVAKSAIEATFGALAARPAPPRSATPPVILPREVRWVVTLPDECPTLYLVWPSPAFGLPGDAEMDIAALIMEREGAGRLVERLVCRERTVDYLSVFQESKELGSEFRIVATAAEGADLEVVKGSILEEIDRMAQEGPTEEEMDTAQACLASTSLRRAESLKTRASILSTFPFRRDDPQSVAQIIGRGLAASAADVRSCVGKVLGSCGLDLRALPEGAKAKDAELSRRPQDLSKSTITLPSPQTIVLGNGVPLTVLSRPGTGLFKGGIIVGGGERLVSAEQAGLAALAASWLTRGVGGRGRRATESAALALGACLSAEVSWHDTQVVVSGLSSRLGPTLDLLTEAVLRPTLDAREFELAKSEQIENLWAAKGRETTVACLAARAQVFGEDDPRGRNTGGSAETLRDLVHEDARKLLPKMLSRRCARFAFVGDVDVKELVNVLESRFRDWPAIESEPPILGANKEAGVAIAYVNPPDSPQAAIVLLRLLPHTDALGSAAREVLNYVLGGSYSSRLNMSLRENKGIAYKAESELWQEGGQDLLQASCLVEESQAGNALIELKREIEKLASGELTQEELDRARESLRLKIISAFERTDTLWDLAEEMVINGVPDDHLHRRMEAPDHLTLDRVAAETGSGFLDWGAFHVVIVARTERSPAVKEDLKP